MKKTYIQPETEVVKIQATSEILQHSFSLDTHEEELDGINAMVQENRFPWEEEKEEWWW